MDAYIQIGLLLLYVVLFVLLLTKTVRKSEFNSYVECHKREHNVHWAEHDKINDDITTIINNASTYHRETISEITKVLNTVDVVDKGLKAERKILFPEFSKLDEELDNIKEDISYLAGLNNVNIKERRNARTNRKSKQYTAKSKRYTKDSTGTDNT